MLRVPVQEEAAQVQEDARDAGTAAVGDSVLTAPVASSHAPSMLTPVAADMPDKPLPGQARPNASGRCRSRPQVVINGGCWLKVEVDLSECKESEDNYVYKGACYQPGYAPPPPATSNPTESRDGGN
jgi:serine/threonine-protein kinase